MIKKQNATCEFLFFLSLSLNNNICDKIVSLIYKLLIENEAFLDKTKKKMIK